MSYLVLHAVTPVHVGVGQGVAGVNLPIARQKPYGFPYIPGSTIKGCLRAQVASSENTLAVFGPAADDDAHSAGNVFFGDACLVAMPVRSAAKTFVWVSCDAVLRRAERVLGQSFVVAADSKKVVLENDLEVTARTCSSLVAWIASHTGHAVEFVSERCLVVGDDEYSILQEFCTQVDVRNRIDLQTGVVRDTALWSEESLAPESLLLAPFDVRGQAVVELGSLTQLRTLTLGGKNTVGRGVCRLSWEVT